MAVPHVKECTFSDWTKTLSLPNLYLSRNVQNSKTTTDPQPSHDREAYWQDGCPYILQGVEQTCIFGREKKSVAISVDTTSRRTKFATTTKNTVELCSLL